MDYLDYVQMTKGQRFAYKFTSFFKGIPGAIVKLFATIGYFIKKFFVSIGMFFRNYGMRFAKGDAGTKLSYIVMGAGNMMHKQLMKGFIFLATEVAYIYFMITFGSYYITRIYSGTVDDPVMLSSKKSKGFYKFGTGAIGSEVAVFKSTGFKEEIQNPDTYDNSNKILLFFALTCLITIAFIAVYIANTKSAYKTQEIIASGKRPMNFKEEMSSFLDERFHITLLALPVLLLITFTIMPIIFTIFMAFTNYDEKHQPPSTLYQWVGMKNFADVFYSNPMKSETFGKILIWTLIWAVFATFTNFIFGIILALLINKKGIKFKGFWRTM
ncbi:MAG: sugar ABC transporter permease, partial [Clostridia bacterium]|nr:sugar ABC transporter permease [Clostridia bacterium]